MNDFFKGDSNFVGTKGLVFVGDEVLIYRRDKKTSKYPLNLDVPGGGAERGETPFETFKREVREELGLDLETHQIVYSRRYQSSNNADEFGWYAVAKLPEEAKSKIVFGNEGTEWYLMRLDDFLGRKDAWPAYQQRAADYVNSVTNKLPET